MEQPSACALGRPRAVSPSSLPMKPAVGWGCGTQLHFSRWLLTQILKTLQIQPWKSTQSQDRQPGQVLYVSPYSFSSVLALAYFPMCSCWGGGTRLERCSSCHGEKLGFSRYLFNLFLNGSVLQYVKPMWLASTPAATNLGLCFSLLKSTVKSQTSFAADSASFVD